MRDDLPMAPDRAEPRAARSSASQDRFVELFAEAFGVEKVQLLSPEHPVRDIDGTTRFVDFAISPSVPTPSGSRSRSMGWCGTTPRRSRSRSLKTDCCVRTASSTITGEYRWTDRQLAQDAEQVKEQLILFLGAVPASWRSTTSCGQPTTIRLPPGNELCPVPAAVPSTSRVPAPVAARSPRSSPPFRAAVVEDDDPAIRPAGAR
jgi:hypothetical protein